MTKKVWSGKEYRSKAKVKVCYCVGAENCHDESCEIRRAYVRKAQKEEQ